MIRRFAALLLLAGLVLAAAPSSCIDFDGQLVRVHHDAEHDRLDALLIYRNLHADGPVESGAMGQLEPLLAGRRWVAVVSHWPYAIDLDGLLESDERADDPPELQRLMALLDEHCRVQPGRLWLDREDGLCGWQLFRLGAFSEVLAALESVLRSVLLADDGDELRDLLRDWGVKDALAVDHVRERLESGWRLLRWDGQSLVLRMPLRAQEWVALKRLMLTEPLEHAFRKGHREGDELGTAMADDDLRMAVEFLARNEWSVGWTDGAVEVRLGLADAVELRLETPIQGKPQRDDLLEPLRARDVAIATRDLDAEALAAWDAWRDEDTNGR